jgi:AcrR family transcriptional regulator
VSTKTAVKILQAAKDCFAEAGFHGATTKEISNRADCTEGSLFRLFGSKEKLFEAALREAFESGRMPNAELARILENDSNFERALRKAMLEFFDRLDEKYVRIASFAMLERPEIVRELLFDLPATVMRALAHTIEREIYRGNLRDDIDPLTAALQLKTSIWHFALISPILSPQFKVTSREARRGAVKNFVEIWFHGMRKTPPKTPRKSG